MFYYVTTDEQGFITQISKEEQESIGTTKWTMIFVPLEEQSNFVTYFDKFRVDDEGVLQTPGNLPSITVSALQEQIKGLGNANSQLQGSVVEVTKDNANLQSQAQDLLNTDKKLAGNLEANQQLLSFVMSKLSEMSNFKVGK